MLSYTTNHYMVKLDNICADGLQEQTYLALPLISAMVFRVFYVYKHN